MTLFTTWCILFVCSCDIPGVPHDDLEFKSTQNGRRRARILQVSPLPVEEVEQERQSFPGIMILRVFLQVPESFVFLVTWD